MLNSENVIWGHLQNVSNQCIRITYNIVCLKESPPEGSHTLIHNCPPLHTQQPIITTHLMHFYLNIDIYKTAFRPFKPQTGEQSILCLEADSRVVEAASSCGASG